MGYRPTMTAFGLLTLAYGALYLLAPEQMWGGQGLVGPEGLGAAGRVASRDLGAVDMGVGAFALALRGLEPSSLRRALLLVFSGTTLLLSAVLAHALLSEGAAAMTLVGLAITSLFGLAFLALALARSSRPAAR